jgi:hypothetical protein
MKKLFAIATITLIFTSVLAGCKTEEVKTTLTIKNLSGKILRNAKWQGVGFTEDVSDLHHITLYYINPGSNATKEIAAGTGYIYFEASLKKLRTQELVSVDKGKDAVFTFTDNTIVVEMANSGNIGPLSGF